MWESVEVPWIAVFVAAYVGLLLCGATLASLLLLASEKRLWTKSWEYLRRLILEDGSKSPLPVKEVVFVAEEVK